MESPTGVSMKVTSSSADCQRWMNKGVLCTYGFQRGEAIKCFEKALVYDKQCAMAHYFIAYCNAVNYNEPEGRDYSLGFKKTQKALELSKSGSHFDWERVLIEAQVHRFCNPVGSKPLSELNEDYARVMKPVYEKFGDEHVAVAAIYAEALMLLRPWALWTKPPIKPAAEETVELVGVLERALKKNPTHPGLCHYYIHTMELSDSPEKALPIANVLRNLYIDQGHLLHMPSHIDMWVGQYKEAIEANVKAIGSDEDYVSRTGRDNEVYKMCRMHNLHFAAWVCMFDGQCATAMKYAEKAEREIDTEAVKYKLGDVTIGSTFLEGFASIPWHVLVRFGRWEEIIQRPLRSEEDLFSSTLAISHYARGIAFAVMGKFDEADRERELFYSFMRKEACQKCYLFNNPMHDPEKHQGILDVAEEVLNGELEYHKGNFREAFQHLRLAVQRDASLIYDEPWGWMTPTRHVLGALLLEHGEVEEVKEAEEVYREDLKNYKDNLWSLLGLHQALKLQKKEEEAERVCARLKKASIRSDVKIGASCLCATKMCCLD